MRLLDKKWLVPANNWGLQHLLTSELQISPIMAQILINRGITSPQEARLFLDGSLADLSSSWLLTGMAAAVDRIMQALEAKSRILIFGDYDVDGMTATALLFSFLQKQGAAVGYYIPERAEGYGLNMASLAWAKEEGYQLVITVDCGIAALDEIDYGQQLGLDFVITDHHEPGPILPAVEGIINPKLAADHGPINELAGVGVAFKLMQALGEKLNLPAETAYEYLDLVALGTVADVVPLVGENRLLVKYGLPLLGNSMRVGIQALLEVAGIKGASLNARQIAFGLAPRLNAAGRMDSPLLGLELLLTESAQRARELALRLQELNSTRQLLEQQTMKEAVEMIAAEKEAGQVLVLASSLWHPGVLGIVASRLADNYRRPTILLTIEGDKAKGSGRSIPGFDFYKALTHCSDLLLKAGGHCQAVGLSIDVELLPAFRAKINDYAATMINEDLIRPFLELEGEVLPEQLDFQLLDELLLLAPFGQGNPEPILVLRHTLLQDYRGVGKEGKHLKFSVAVQQKELDGIGFNLTQVWEQGLDLERPVNLAFRLQPNEWNGKINLQLILEDIQGYVTPPHDENNPGAAIDLPAKQGKHYRCAGAREHFQRLLALVQGAVTGGHKPVIITFPSRRLLALYERPLEDSLADYGIKCIRFHATEQITVLGMPAVLLAVRGLDLIEGEVHTVINLIFSDAEVSIPAAGRENEFWLSFKQISIQNYGYFRNPTAADAKLPYVAALAENASGPLYIYASRTKEIMSLFQGLQKLLPHKKRGIWYYHHGLCKEQRDLVRQAASYGLAEIVIAGEFLELQMPFSDVKHERILLDAPYSLDEFFLKARPHGENLTVHGLWQEDELQRNEMILKTIFPEGQVLADLLTALQEIGVTEEKDTASLVAALGNRFRGLQMPTLQSALNMVQELANMGGTRDYTQTRVYQSAKKAKESLAELKRLDNITADQVAAFILTGSRESLS